MLLRRSGVEEVDAVLDASFLKAWSIRNPDDNQDGPLGPGCACGQEREKLRPRIQAPHVGGPEAYPAAGQRAGAGEREREEARAVAGGEDPGGAGEGWCEAEVPDRGQPVQQRGG